MKPSTLRRAIRQLGWGRSRSAPSWAAGNDLLFVSVICATGLPGLRLPNVQEVGLAARGRELSICGCGVRRGVERALGSRTTSQEMRNESSRRHLTPGAVGRSQVALGGAKE